MSKGLGDLLIKLFSVSNDNNARVKAAHFHKDILRHHNHSQRLATTLGVPNNTTLAVSCTIILLNCLNDFFDGKELLITADLLDVCIVKNKIFAQCQQTVRIEQRNNISVLLCNLSTNHVLIKQLVLPRQRLLAPYAPKVLSSAASRILNRVFVSSNYNLSKLE